MTPLNILKALWSIATIPVPLILAVGIIGLVFLKTRDFQVEQCNARASIQKVNGLELQLKVQKTTSAEKQRLLEQARNRSLELQRKVDDYEKGFKPGGACASPADARKLRELGR